MSPVLIIDNYDSFTYNLVQALLALGADTLVRRNDVVTLDEIDELNPTHLVISPGPGTPDDAGISIAAIRHLAGRTPILGVCLGHQAISQAFGGRVVRAERPMHGKPSLIHHDGSTIYRGLPNPLQAGRYHSLIVQPEDVPPGFIVTAHTSEGQVMGMRHQALPIEGVQFHPESILTPQGPQLLANFLKLRSERAAPPGRAPHGILCHSAPSA